MVQQRGSGEISVDADRIQRGKSIELVSIKLKCVYEGEGIGGTKQVRNLTSVHYKPIV
jgi:hypothetical protein